MSTEKRRQRKMTRLMQQESVWLQKALFAFGKLEDTREKLADTREEDPEPLELEIDGRSVQVEAIEEALESRIQQLLTTVRERRNAMH
jgi:hypothetical protein